VIKNAIFVYVSSFLPVFFRLFYQTREIRQVTASKKNCQKINIPHLPLVSRCFVSRQIGIVTSNQSCSIARCGSLSHRFQILRKIRSFADQSDRNP